MLKPAHSLAQGGVPGHAAAGDFLMGFRVLLITVKGSLSSRGRGEPGAGGPCHLPVPGRFFS